MHVYFSSHIGGMSGCDIHLLLFIRFSCCQRSFLLSFLIPKFRILNDVCPNNYMGWPISCNNDGALVSWSEFGYERRRNTAVDLIEFGVEIVLNFENDPNR